MLSVLRVQVSFICCELCKAVLHSHLVLLAFALFILRALHFYDYIPAVDSVAVLFVRFNGRLILFFQCPCEYLANRVALESSHRADTA